MQLRMSRRNDDVMEKEVRYKSVCGCEKRNVHALVADRYCTRSMEYEKSIANTATGISCENKRKTITQVDRFKSNHIFSALKS